MENKYYLYGTVKASESVSLGPLSLSTTGTPDEIRMHVKDGLGVAYVTRETEDDEIAATRKNLVTHQKVVERLMEQFGVVIPFAFGTLFDSLGEVDQLLDERRTNFYTMFDKIDGKVELTLKMMWEKMEPVFAEIVEANDAIRAARSLVQGGLAPQNEQIALGKMVEDALLLKKETLCQQIIAPLAELAVDHKIQKNITEAMFVNVNFLVKREDESKFDEAVNNVGNSHQQNVLIKYIGPAAPVNFL